MAKDPSTVTIRIDATTSRRLDELAHQRDKTREQLVLEALHEHLRHADPAIGTDKPVPPPRGG